MTASTVGSEESHLELNEEEAIFRGRSCCVKSVRREPYAQLGSVAPAELCCGACVNVALPSGTACLFICFAFALFVFFRGEGCSLRINQDVSGLGEGGVSLYNQPTRKGRPFFPPAALLR